MTRVTTLRRFEIVRNQDEWAVYRDVQDIEGGEAGPLAAVERMAASSTTPNRIRLPAPHPDRPERFLDIHEDRSDGEYTYVFHLNHKPDGEYQAHFADPPIKLIDVAADELKDFFSEQLIKPQWATLTVDIGSIRGSCIAKALREKDFKSIQIPFHFNMIDNDFKFSPGLLPHDHHHRAAKTSPPIVTHGGIHPPMASFYDLTL